VTGRERPISSVSTFARGRGFEPRGAHGSNEDMRACSFLPRLGALAALAVPGSHGGSAHAQGGVQDGAFHPLVYFAYPEDDPTAWEPVFTEYSKLLSNSTEGGLQLGTVTFTVCPDLQDEADIWVLSDFSGARAHLNGLGVPGLHITISQTHKSTAGAALGQFGLAHESGHYLFGVYDEYKGFVGNEPETSSLHFCSFENSTRSCIMDGGSTISPNNQRTEYCTRTQLGFPETVHNNGLQTPQGFSAVNDQQYYLGRSCWQQIQRDGTGGLTHPTSEVSFAVPPHAPVTFDYARYQGDLAVAIVLDRSGSMSAEGRLEAAVLGAKSGVGLMRDGEALAIVSFSDVPVVTFPAQTLTAQRKANANAALDQVTAGGGTVLGTAVLAAVDELAKVPGCVELLLIVTDGASEAPDVDDPAVLQALTDGGHAVFAVAVGSFPEADALNTVAAATGGQFFQVADASQLPGVIATIFAVAGSGTAILADFEATLAGLDAAERTFEVGDVGAGVALRVGLTFSAGADLGLVLTAPDGSEVDFAAPPPDADVFASEVQKTLTLSTPEPGTWSARVSEPVGAAASYDLFVFLEAPEFDVTTSARATKLAFPAPMQVAVSVVSAVPVGGARVEGEVERPDRSRVPVVFHDDGLAVHGDDKAEDGVYSTRFARYAGDGAYTFRIDVDGTGGRAASNLECGVFGAGGPGEEGQASFPIAPFTACVTHTVVLTGQQGPPSVGGAVLERHPAFTPTSQVRLDRAPTPVGAFRLEVAADEPLVLGPLELRLRRPGDDASEAARLSLHLDADGDGLLDEPSVPLALGSLSADETRLVLDRPIGSAGGASELALLAAGATHSFLLVAGDGLAEQELAFRTAAAGSAAFSPGHLLPGALVLLALLALRPGRASSERPIRGRLAFSLCLLLLALSFPACSHGRNRAALVLVVEPAELVLTGAVTGAPILARGSRETFSVQLD